ncbi:hypothetical protein F2P81_007578 [Scophthalmus maximus]|uniref:Uncharacterized protein n=1 Tax=Scophthalmus maximus TaxID=52904 RepID=A0A6A4SZS6_SCOMX|nr:hypothetical protein F2P81_007578 [Scophthalmus maximus]
MGKNPTINFQKIVIEVVLSGNYRFLDNHWTTAVISQNSMIMQFEHNTFTLDTDLSSTNPMKYQNGVIDKKAQMISILDRNLVSLIVVQAAIKSNWLFACNCMDLMAMTERSSPLEKEVLLNIIKVHFALMKKHPAFSEGAPKTRFQERQREESEKREEGKKKMQCHMPPSSATAISGHILGTTFPPLPHSARRSGRLANEVFSQKVLSMDNKVLRLVDRTQTQRHRRRQNEIQNCKQDSGTGNQMRKSDIVCQHPVPNIPQFYRIVRYRITMSTTAISCKSANILLLPTVGGNLWMLI